MTPVRRLSRALHLPILILLAAAGAACGAASSEPSDSAPAAGSCELTIVVSGDVAFSARGFPFNTGVADKNGQSWVTLMGNQVTRREHPFVLWLSFPRSAGVGEVPFNSPGQGQISLNLVGGSEYQPSKTAQRGESPGTLSITKLDDAWAAGRGLATLTDSAGGQVEVEVEFSIALPPARCP